MSSRNLPKRDPNRVLAEKSIRAVRASFPPEWVINDVQDDYGEDFHVEIFRDSFPTGFEFAVQVKATARTSSDGSFSVRLPWKTINYLMQRPMPALLAAYNSTTNEVHYIWIEEYLFAREYAGRLNRRTKSLTVRFTTDTRLDSSEIPSIIDYFEVAGVSAKCVDKLLTKLPESGADERYRILQKLRFLRTDSGVLYLLSQSALDFILSYHELVSSSSAAATMFLQACMSRLTPGGTMLFWGAAADMALNTGESKKPTGKQVFCQMLPKMLELSPEKLARYTYELFGYSTVTGLQNMGSLIQNEQFNILVATLCNRIESLRKQYALSPRAPDLYAGLYTVRNIDGCIVHLLDTEVAKLWDYYYRGKEQLQLEKPEAEEMALFGRGYFESLINVFGFNVRLDLQDEADMQTLLQSMAVKKVDLFSQLNAEREHYEGTDHSEWDRSDLIVYMNREMLINQQMYLFSCALDWFEISCFTREHFVRESFDPEDAKRLGMPGFSDAD